MNKNLFAIVLTSAVCFIACVKSPTNVEKTVFSWDIASPESQGMNAQKLDSALSVAEQKEFIDAIVVVRNGVIVAERYYNGYTRNTPHNIRSVSKSFLGAMIGIAFDRGYLKGPDQKMMVFFREYDSPLLDKRLWDVTLGHLLTMHMGIDDENINFMQVYHSSDWVRATLELPLIFNPGQRMRYNTFETHLLSVILTKASKMSSREFADHYLLDPLGITLDKWERDPQGYYFGGTDMYFTPREMAAFGTLYLNMGNQHGVQIVPQQWIERSTSPFTRFRPNEWGDWKNYNYGYLWWTGEFNQIKMYLAYGYGGQFIANFPTLNMTIVTTARDLVDYDTSTVQEWALFEIIAKFIVPAILF